MSSILAVFAKAPEPGRVKTRLCPPLSPEEAADLYRAFLEDTLFRLGSHARARGVEFAVCHFPPDAGDSLRPLAPSGARFVPQRGEGLAARMSNFFSDAFAAGARAVVIVGSDAPTLPLVRIDEAFAALRDGAAAAIVPDQRGGYCLVGLSRPAPSLFDGIEIGSDRVYEQTVERAEKAGLRLVRLEAWHDVDLPADLARLRRELADPRGEAPRTREVVERFGLSRRFS